jgi:hypothetical protein
VNPLTLTDIQSAIRASWADDTCSPDDVWRTAWHESNPAWGHCDVTALVLNDLLGGDLVLAEVHLNGEQRGFHYWNRLGDGIEVDLTREQFVLGEVITFIKFQQRPPGPLPRRHEEYVLFRSRVFDRLQ